MDITTGELKVSSNSHDDFFRKFLWQHNKSLFISSKVIEYGAGNLGFQPQGDLPEGIVVPPPVPGNDTDYDEQFGGGEEINVDEEQQQQRFVVENRARGTPRQPTFNQFVQQPSQNRGQDIQAPVTPTPKPRLPEAVRTPSFQARPIAASTPERPQPREQFALDAFSAFQTPFDFPRGQIEEIENRRPRPQNEAPASDPFAVFQQPPQQIARPTQDNFRPQAEERRRVPVNLQQFVEATQPPTAPALLDEQRRFPAVVQQFEETTQPSFFDDRRRFPAVVQQFDETTQPSLPILVEEQRRNQPQQLQEEKSNFNGFARPQEPTRPSTDAPVRNVNRARARRPSSSSSASTSTRESVPRRLALERPSPPQPPRQPEVNHSLRPRPVAVANQDFASFPAQPVEEEERQTEKPVRFSRPVQEEERPLEKPIRLSRPGGRLSTSRFNSKPVEPTPASIEARFNPRPVEPTAASFEPTPRPKKVRVELPQSFLEPITEAPRPNVAFAPTPVAAVEEEPEEEQSFPSRFASFPVQSASDRRPFQSFEATRPDPTEPESEEQPFLRPVRIRGGRPKGIRQQQPSRSEPRSPGAVNFDALIQEFSGRQQPPIAQSERSSIFNAIPLEQKFQPQPAVPLE